jgi:hypothetical protein
MVLIVDVGTNAEILLGNGTRVLACSSPTGPAFEGAQISSGQRAAPGAIERVEIDPVTKEPRFRVIGSTCGRTIPALPRRPRPPASPASADRASSRRWPRCAWPGFDPGGLIGSAEQTGTARCDAEGRTHSYVLHDGSAERRAADHRDAGRHPRDPAGEIGALCGRAAVDGRDGRRHGRPGDAGRRLRRPYQPEARDGAGHDPRRAARQGRQRRQRRRDRRAHRAVQPSPRATGSRRRCTTSTRSRPPSSRASRSIS